MCVCVCVCVCVYKLYIGNLFMYASVHIWIIYMEFIYVGLMEYVYVCVCVCYGLYVCKEESKCIAVGVWFI